MPRSYYSDNIVQFLKSQNNWILGKLVNNHQFELKEQQRNVWIKEIEILKEEFKDLTSAYVIFEYSIPRMGKRADIILILNGLVFVIEFKLYENRYKNSDINQCFDYVLDLKYFHEASYNIKILSLRLLMN
ncbi:MAG: hypothetical protein ACXWE7_13955 [Nitrososphaeraceae archaeon]